MQNQPNASAPGSSRVIRFADQPVQHRPNGAESRNMFAAQLLTGEQVSLHQSMQPAGLAPAPVHSINHSELLCLREGTLAFSHDGRTERVEAGDVVLIAFGTSHSFRNIGEGPASYFVVSIGGDTNRG